MPDDPKNPEYPDAAKLPIEPSYCQGRSRLNKLTDWERYRVVLIGAAAGSGKTVLLASNLRRSKRRIFWHSFQSIEPGFAGLARRMAAAFGCEAVPPDPRSLLATVIRLIEDTPRGWDIVLDDFSYASSDRQMADFVERLAVYMPPGNTLFLSSREEVKISASKDLAAYKIGDAELKFTGEEIECLFRTLFPERELRSEHVHRVLERTEGWAAGLGLCVQFLQGRPGMTLARALAKFEAEGARWDEFFAQEIVEGLAPELKEFLFRCSILSWMTARLCNMVLEREDSGAWLKQLVERNTLIFPVALDRPRPAGGKAGGRDGGNAGGWDGAACEIEDAYRFLPIFRDYLAKELERALGEAGVKALRRRAGEAYAKEGAFSEAAVFPSPVSSRPSDAES